MSFRKAYARLVKKDPIIELDRKIGQKVKELFDVYWEQVEIIYPMTSLIISGTDWTQNFTSGDGATDGAYVYSTGTGVLNNLWFGIPWIPFGRASDWRAEQLTLNYHIESGLAAGGTLAGFINDTLANDNPNLESIGAGIALETAAGSYQTTLNFADYVLSESWEHGQLVFSLSGTNQAASPRLLLMAMIIRWQRAVQVEWI